MMNESVVNMAATALTSWKSIESSGNKHIRDNDAVDDETNRAIKRARAENAMVVAANPTMNDPMSPLTGKGELRPYPFFYYKDHSTEPDPDPLTPLTFPGRVPNFPAKLHAILSRSDLSDIIDWLPHGRSWRVLKPRDFELKIIPKFFEHSKFSSFVRQANGWGFRRITQGPDRNSYYHEKFLRGLPHLCKTMKRPGVSEKKVVDPDLEPDFYKISDIHPIPQNADEESIFLQKTLQSGPKSRMPIITSNFKKGKAGAVSSDEEESTKSEGSYSNPNQAPVHGQAPSYEGHCYTMPALAPAPSSGSLSESVHPSSYQTHAPAPSMEESHYGGHAGHYSQAPAPSHTSTPSNGPVQTDAPSSQPLVLAPASSESKNTSFPASCMMMMPPAMMAGAMEGMKMGMMTPENMPKATEVGANGGMQALSFPLPAMDGNSASAQSFAAGFAAATAHYQQQFMAMMSKMAASQAAPSNSSKSSFTSQSA